MGWIYVVLLGALKYSRPENQADFDLYFLSMFSQNCGQYCIFEFEATVQVGGFLGIPGLW